MTTTVYRAYDPAGALLYIGIADDFGRRMKEHAKASGWYAAADRWTFELYPTRCAAASAEIAAIHAEHPRHNVIGAAGHPADCACQSTPRPPVRRARRRRKTRIGNVAKRPDGRWRARWRGLDGREHARHFDRRADAIEFLSTIDPRTREAS